MTFNFTEKFDLDGSLDDVLNSGSFQFVQLVNNGTLSVVADASDSSNHVIKATAPGNLGKADLVKRDFEFHAGDTVRISTTYYIPSASTLDGLFLMDLESKSVWADSNTMANPNVGIRVYLDGPEGYLCLDRTKIGEEEAFKQSMVAIPTDQWVTIELVVKLGIGSAGYTEIRLSGEPVLAQTGTNFPDPATLNAAGIAVNPDYYYDRAQIGMTLNNTGISQTLYFDDVSMSQDNTYNIAPVVQNDALDTLVNVPLVVTANQLLANDIDGNGETMTVISVGNAVNGTVALVAGQVTFTPMPGFIGEAQFSYTVRDSKGATDTATCSVHVDSGNNAPVTKTDLWFLSNATAATMAFNSLTGNDTDQDGDALSVTSIASTTGVATSLGVQGINITSTATTAKDLSYSITDNHGGTATSIVRVTTITTTDAANTFTIASTPGTASYVDARGGDDTVTGGGGADAVFGGAGNDSVTGGAGDDTLDGGFGDDTLTGGTGSDKMAGSAGNDTYVVDAMTDTVSEKFGEGLDQVKSSVSFVLSDYVDDLTLTGTLAINGTGNAQDNVLTGNSAANTLTGADGNDRLDGAAGVDTLIGGAGNDAYFVDVSTDKVIEDVGSGIDQVASTATYVLSANVENLTLTGTAATNGTGNASANVIAGNAGNNLLSSLDGNDTLTGAAGNDTLDGGLGLDVMSGGAGNDTYIVSQSDDVCSETSGSGTDTVLSDASYVLAAGIEALTLRGTANLNGTGNILANTLTGNSGNNLLDGGAGADKMTGGLGDDAYFVDNTGDTVIEAANAGTDGVNSQISYALGANVENLTLLGTSALNGTGNTLNNVIHGNAGKNTLTGNDGNDTLIGGAGNDTLSGGNGNDTVYGGGGADAMSGGAGADRFVWHSAGKLGSIGSADDGFPQGGDTITDFSRVQGDVLDISSLLVGYVSGISDVDDFVRVTASGSNALLQVDVDGAANGVSFLTQATLVGVASSSLPTVEAMVAAGNIDLTP